MSNQLAKAAADVVRAWTKPGANPAYHAKQQERLAKSWPRLAEAIQELVIQAECPKQNLCKNCGRPIVYDGAADWFHDHSQMYSCQLRGAAGAPYAEPELS